MWLLTMLLIGCAPTAGFTYGPVRQTPAVSGSPVPGSSPAALPAATPPVIPCLCPVAIIPPGKLPAGTYAEFYMRPHFSLRIPDGFLLAYAQPDAFGLIEDTVTRQPRFIAVVGARKSSVIAAARGNPLFRVTALPAVAIDGHSGLAAEISYLGSQPTGGELFTLRDSAIVFALEPGETVHLVEFEVDGVRLIFLAVSATIGFVTFAPIVTQVQDSIVFLAN